MATASGDGVDSTSAPLTAILIGAGMVCLIVVNALLLVGISYWQDEAADLVAANEESATALSALRADIAEQAELWNLLDGQLNATEDRLVDLEDTEASAIADAYEMRDAILGLVSCHDAQRTHIDHLWTTMAAWFALDEQSAVDAQCQAAEQAFDQAKANIDE